MPRHSTGGSYVHPQEHTRKIYELAHVENIPLQAQLQPPLFLKLLNTLCGGNDIADALRNMKSALGEKGEQIQAWREVRNASLRSRRQALNSLNHRDKPGKNPKDNTDKDSDCPELILKESHC